MKYIVQIALLIATWGLHAQGTYEMFPAWGPRVQPGSADICVCNDTTFFLMSELLDTLPNGELGVISAVGQFTHSGAQLITKKFISSDSIKPHQFRGFKAEQIGDRLYTRVVRFPNDTIREELFIEYNLNTLEFDQVFEFQTPQDSVLLSRISTSSRTDEGGWVLGVAVSPYGGAQNIEIVELDSTFKEVNRVRHIEESFNIGPVYVNKLSEGMYEAIGPMIENAPSKEMPEFWLFHLTINASNGTSELKRLEGSENLIFGLADVVYVHRKRTGEYIIVPQEVKSCGNPWCAVYIPNILEVNADFSEILWRKELYQVDEEDLNDVYYLTSSILRSPDASGYLTMGQESDRRGDALSWRSAIYLFKVNHFGDSLWYRRYRPLSWSEDESHSLFMFDIEPCDDGYLMAGRAYDTGLGAVIPYVVKIDEYGCLIPGCNETTSSVDPTKGDLLKFYPNPVRDLLYIQGLTQSSQVITIELIDANGRKMRSTQVQPKLGGQYFLPMHNLPPGMYVARVLSADGQLQEAHQVIVQ